VSTIEQMALDALNREPGQQPGENASQYAKRIAIAALREQPEARGVVDEDRALAEAFREIAKCSHAQDGVAGELFQAVRNKAALIAAQQPVQEGGGEVATARRLAVGLWQRHYREVAPQWEPCPDLAGLLSQIDNMASGLRRFDDTAPPSAPVGVDLDKVAAHLAEHGGDFDALIQLVRDAALAQQPAQAAPGDGRDAVWCKKASELLPPWQWNMVNDAVKKELRATPPGDDTAGGG
jgi:hypothetical protein